MAIAKLASVPLEPDTYHGLPVLEMHVGDPIPAPRAPARYAVRLTPDLARYLLSFNHQDNRNVKSRKIKAMASDMVNGRWQLTPQGLVFNAYGVLINGQNTLLAVTESGTPIWTLVDFGWPDAIIEVIDRGTSRSLADTLKINGIANSANVAAAYAKVWQYDRLVGTMRSFNGFDLPTSSDTSANVSDDADLWQKAANTGVRLYRGLAKGGSPTIWTTSYFLIARDASPQLAELFFNELEEQAGAPGSATRELAKHFTRRPITHTLTADSREPLELIVRAFNAWQTNKRLVMVGRKGFTLSRIRP